MQLVPKKKFEKKIKKLSKKIKEKAFISLWKYKNWVHDKELNLHKLKWNFKKYWIINVTWDIRILLNPKTWEIVDILDIWNHNYFY